MAPFSNKRRHRRFSVDVMDIQGNAVFASEIVINDISITGVSMITERKLNIGMEYSLRILENDLDLPIRGTVIWCMENEAAAAQDEYSHLKYAAGLQFNDLQQEAMAGLIKFIESHLLEKHKQVKVHEMSGLRCNIRFHLDTKETAVLNIAETYTVKKLSLGGLLIESSRSFEPDTRIHMGITMPGNMHLSFIGRVASCVVSPDNSSCFEVGIEFIEMPEPDRITLKEFIRRLYLEDAGFSIDGIPPNARK
ncbi:MAG: PilZ domain-containing protein [Nitrospirota bacterium]|nr:PilZ domain-containing protein [Nitrospirota bacterium]